MLSQAAEIEERYYVRPYDMPPAGAFEECVEWSEVSVHAE
jgi:hypothetical protein